MTSNPFSLALLALQLPQVPAAGTGPADPAAGQAIEQLGQTVTDTGQMLLEGQWAAALAAIRLSVVEMAGGLLPGLIRGLFVGVVFYAIYFVVYRVSRSALRRSKHIGPGVEHLLLRTLSVAGLGFILVVVLSQLGLNVAALVAGLGIAGLALGFAAQDTLANFIAGVTILLDRPFAVGHFVQVDNTYGEVTELTLRSTRIRTLGNRIYVVPNVTMVNQNLTNFSDGGPERALRVDIPFGIAYKERPAEARKIVLSLVADDERLYDDPAPDVVVTGLNDSSVDMMLRVHVKDPRNEYQVRFHYLERIREALREADIEIPFPHVQVFIDEAKGLTGEGAPPIRFATAG
jgi:small conductance mechanosensitive channel